MQKMNKQINKNIKIMKSTISVPPSKTNTIFISSDHDWLCNTEVSERVLIVCKHIMDIKHTWIQLHENK